MLNQIHKFLNWVVDGLIRGAHARFGVFLPKPIDEPKPVGLMFVFEELWPESSDEARDALMWMTPYPFVSLNDVATSLRIMRARWGPRIGAAIDGEMAEFDRIWEETRPQREVWENEGGKTK